MALIAQAMHCTVETCGNGPTRQHPGASLDDLDVSWPFMALFPQQRLILRNPSILETISCASPSHRTGAHRMNGATPTLTIWTTTSAPKVRTAGRDWDRVVVGRRLGPSLGPKTTRFSSVFEGSSR